MTRGAISLNRRPYLYRVQAGDGRGPWRPGLSHHWVDASRVKLQDDIITAFGLEWKNKIPKGWARGCACRSLEALMDWFTPIEQERLEAIGYTPIGFHADLVVAENADQVLFARRTPLYQGVDILHWRISA